MPRPDLSRVGSFFHRYINQVPQDDIQVALHDLGNEFLKLMESIPSDKQDYAYAPGKWTMREVFQHIIDTERILSYRALCFSRKEQQNLPGFDEDSYAAHSKAANRKWKDMLDEFASMRRATELLFSSFDKDQLESGGIANNNPNYTLGMGFIIAGHCQHHVNLIKERYLK
jgi:hypothetical protein